MYRLLSAVAALIVATACASGGQDAGGSQTCDFVTFARFGGIRYMPSRTNEGLRGVVLGPEYARVARSLSRETGGCDGYTPSDGDATDVRVGTPFFEVEGYPARLLLATEIGLWEADYAPDAETGGDVLDIGSKVIRIAILGGADPNTELGAVEDAALIAALFEAIRTAPVVRGTDQRGEVLRHWLRFEMDDGLVFQRIYRQDTGELWNGIILPPPARQLILDALR